MTTRVVLVLALLAGQAWAGEQAGELVSQAQVALHDLRYEDAVGLADLAWQSGDADPAQLRDIFALAGQAAGAVGDEDSARLWFSRMLCLDPQAQLHAGTSPKLTALFAQARDALGGKALTASAVRNEHETAINVKSDPLGLVVAVRIDGKRIELSGGFATGPGGDERELPLLDRYGNVLATVTIQDFVSPPTQRRPFIARWSTWAIATGVLSIGGGAALYVSLDARSSWRDLNAQSGAHQYIEARTLERRFERFQWVARIGAGASVACAVASALLFARGEHVVVAAPTGSGGSVSWVHGF